VLALSIDLLAAALAWLTDLSASNLLFWAEVLAVVFFAAVVFVAVFLPVVVLVAVLLVVGVVLAFLVSTIIWASTVDTQKKHTPARTIKVFINVITYKIWKEADERN
jgi:hypothetical protein